MGAYLALVRRFDELLIFWLACCVNYWWSGGSSDLVLVSSDLCFKSSTGPSLISLAKLDSGCLPVFLRPRKRRRLLS